MELLIFLFMVILVGVWLLKRSSLYVRIQYSKTVEIDQFDLWVRLFDAIQVYHMQQKDIIEGAIKKQLSKSMPKEKKEGRSQAKDKGKRETRHGAKEINYFKLFTERFACERLQCQIRVHAADADKTAMLYGSTQLVLHVLLSTLKRRMKFAQPPQIAVLSEFQSGRNSLEFQCILSTKLGDIIPILLKKFR